MTTTAFQFPYQEIMPLLVPGMKIMMPMAIIRLVMPVRHIFIIIIHQPRNGKKKQK
jgi:hypothetical protein